MEAENWNRPSRDRVAAGFLWWSLSRLRPRGAGIRVLIGGGDAEDFALLRDVLGHQRERNGDEGLEAVAEVGVDSVGEQPGEDLPVGRLLARRRGRQTRVP